MELAWVGLDKAERLDMPDVTRQVLAELRARLKGGMSPFLPAPFYYLQTESGAAKSFEAEAPLCPPFPQPSFSW